MIALSLLGSASLLLSCSDGDAVSEAPDTEKLKTEHSEHLSIIMSENGRRSYFFRTPLLEGYTLAREPYREFRKGVEITTYQNDSMSTVNTVLTANYAIYYENRKLWEAKGNVVVVKSDGTRLYTQQLFWNSMTEQIYSNVDTKIVKGEDVFFGEGFESDEEIKQWRFRRMTGHMYVDVSQNEDNDDDNGNSDGREGASANNAGKSGIVSSSAPASSSAETQSTQDSSKSRVSARSNRSDSETKRLHRTADVDAVPLQPLPLQAN